MVAATDNGQQQIKKCFRNSFSSSTMTLRFTVGLHIPQISVQTATVLDKVHSMSPGSSRQVGVALEAKEGQVNAILCKSS